MFQQQKKRAGRRGQRRMPVDLETPNAFAAKMRRRSDTPPFVRTPKCSATPALCADAPCAEPLGGARHRGRSVARSVRFAIASEAPDGAHDALSRTRSGKPSITSPPPRRGFAVRPLRGLHFSLHSTARNLQLGARIATRNPQLASKRGRPMHPRAPKMRLISVQMFHVKHSDLNLRFRMRDAHRRAAIHPSDAARCEPSHLLPQPIALRAQRTSSLAHRAHCARPDASRTATPRARHTPPTPSSRPSRLSAIPAGHPRHRTCPPSPRIVREAAADNLPTPRPNRSPQAKDQALSRDRCRNPRGGAAARTCSP